MKLTYLLVNFFSVIVPFIFSFHPKLKFHKYFKEFFIANLIAAFCFLVWDALFTGMGIWGFSDKYTLGFKILGMPFEEILFFICIPFACIFTYHCINIFYKIEWSSSFENVFILGVSVSLVLFGFLHIDKWYTSVTFVSTGILLLALKYLFRVKWLPKFFTIYPLLLIPFFIVNGILTGYGLSEPVVWYNNDENLSIRLLTIPVEDVVYGFELLIFNLFFYEKLKNINI
ncbi:MAG: lycopene cyclase domain-containing protein [Saprospiraceae bacterium]